MIKRLLTLIIFIPLTAMSDVENVSKSVVVGELFQVQLPVNPTTGYIWFVRSIPSEVALTGMEYSRAKDCNDIKNGCGGKMILSMKALTPGYGKLILQRGRPWEQLPEESDEYVIQITNRELPHF